MSSKVTCPVAMRLELLKVGSKGTGTEGNERMHH
jgi:hypothetical protein